MRTIADAGVALRRLAPGGIPVAAGGDGTVGLLVAALHRNGMQDSAIAILPFGTGNILARALGVGDPRQAIRALEHGTVRHIDVMRTSHPAAPFALVSISTGFEGRFLSRYACLRRFGRPVGALAALSVAFGNGGPIALELDGDAVLRPDDGVFSAGLYNTRCYAAGLVMSPGADISDGWGECNVYRTARTYWATVGAALRGASRYPHAGVFRRRWRTAHIESQGPIQLDGEPVSGSAISVCMEPGALAVIVPTSD